MGGLIIKDWTQGLNFSPCTKLYANYGLSYSEIKDMPLRTAPRTKTIVFIDGGVAIGSRHLSESEIKNDFKELPKWI